MPRLLLTAGIVFGLAGCAQLPPLEPRSASTALVDTDTTVLGRAVGAVAGAHPGLSGIHPLIDARDAFAARVVVAGAAQRSLDVQYYIWHQDRTGSILFSALRQAADRGVRVRLLLDDANTSGIDPTLAALDAHPNIEVRLFNPFANRRSRAAGFLTDFSRLNRRMHNKSMTADNQITLVGGRNIGDEYFGAADELGFVDLDVIAVGPVVREVSQQFDLYWASESAYSVERLIPAADAAAVDAVGATLAAIESAPETAAYVDAVRRSTLLTALIERRLPFEWVPVQMVADDPAKGLGRADAATLLTTRMTQIIGRPATEFALMSPYFVPGKTGTELLTGMSRRGVQVRILTNSLQANDVPPVHAGYAKSRRALLQGGVQLYELRRLAPRAGRESSRHGSSSAASLHAKTFSSDRRRLFVGSFNFDPRSVHLNTEMGLIIDSPALAAELADAFERQVRSVAFEVQLSEEGELVWIERHGDETLRHTIEPGTSLWQRGWIVILSLLPIDWLL